MLPRLRLALYQLRFWLRRRRIHLWYHPAYRLPIAGVAAAVGVEPRRADLAAWWLLASRAVAHAQLRGPRLAEMHELARVHTPELLESLGRAEPLAAIFATDAADLAVDEVMRMVRLACGATIDAAREALRTREPGLNLLGGFHHAGPASAGGFCPVNDVAVAVAALRADGFTDRVVVLDLDAHPPDGLVACFGSDRSVWIGSLSGSDWGPLEGADETVLPEGTGDAAYLSALDALLQRMPRPALAFVIAGGDVLAGDRHGRLGLSLAGARERDLRIAIALEQTPAVWLPGGGYHRDAWRVLAGSGLALAAASLDPVPDRDDPLSTRFARVAASLTREELSADAELGADDLEEALGLRRRGPRLLLGFYTASGIEQALFRYGTLGHLRRLGYGPFRVAIDSTGVGERVRLFGVADGAEHLLIELVVEIRPLAGRRVLFVHWLTLRHPRAGFSPHRPQLPGQDAPGLGLARETGELLARIAQRLGLAGVAFRPAHYHTAFSARHHLAFVDPVRQGRFEALVRDLGGLPLRDATRAVAEGRVRIDGQPYAWEPDEMVLWLDGARDASDAIAAERERVHFTVEEEPPARGTA